MEKYLCIHCHYYQPPRENPWLEEIVLQESAFPYHDWNERITQECYRANAQSRIKDERNFVTRIVNNYAKISFNFGPTLLSWLEAKDPLTYEGILAGDRLSLENFGGHGSAIAQAYNHLILPLATRRDKETQIRWGIRDFEHRFGRYPEGMWLPEAAVDSESLEILASEGIKFVILAPRQAKAFRSKSRDEPWQSVGHQDIDPSQAYEVPLPGGRHMVAFFYDGPISQAVAFQGLLHNGEVFAHRLMEGYDGKRSNQAQLLHIATDGETYGHHHPNGDMALAYALAYVEEQKLARVINYGQFLELHPARLQAQIHEGSSWSCAHGIERWRGDCGCNSGMQPGWQQRWRAPLRQAFDEIRDQTTEPFASKLRLYSPDPWRMRDDYIGLILDRSEENLQAFLHRHCPAKNLSGHEIELILKLMEMQRHLLLMYTSCAWFFDDISGIETVQAIQYGYRALELAEECLNLSLEEAFTATLTLAPSNSEDLADGAEVFAQLVKPARVDFLTLGVHFAISSLFKEYKKEERIYSYVISALNHQRKDLGRAKMAFGQAQVRSLITREQKHVLYGVVYFGDHNVNAGAKLIYTEKMFTALAKDMATTFDRADFIGTLHTLYHYFSEPLSTLKDLFKDEQKAIITEILATTMQEVDARLMQLYEANYPLASYLAGLAAPLPKVLRNIAELVQNRSILHALAASSSDSPATQVDVATLGKLLAEAHKWGTTLDGITIAHVLEERLQAMLACLTQDFTNRPLLESLLALITITRHHGFVVDWGPTQNTFYLWVHRNLIRQLQGASQHKDSHAQLLSLYQRLAVALMVRVNFTGEGLGSQPKLWQGRQREDQARKSLHPENGEAPL